MTQPMFMGVPTSPQLAQHAGETVSGLIGLARMRQAQARDHVARLEQALGALEYFAQYVLETRAAYLQQIEVDEGAIAQLVQFASGQVPAAVAAPMPPPMMDPRTMEALHQQGMGVTPLPGQVPGQPAASPFGQPLRPIASVDMRPDAEGRRPVAEITPEMRERWKQTPPVEVSVARPGDEGYVGPNAVRPPLPIPVVSHPALNGPEENHVGSAEPAAQPGNGA